MQRTGRSYLGGRSVSYAREPRIYVCISGMYVLFFFILGVVAEGDRRSEIGII